jgi:hypothetical protein
VNPRPAVILLSLCSLRNAIIPEKVRLSPLFYQNDIRGIIRESKALVNSWVGDRKCPLEPFCLGAQHQNTANDC